MSAYEECLRLQDIMADSAKNKRYHEVGSAWEQTYELLPLLTPEQAEALAKRQFEVVDFPD
jgi:hypothetical protein